MVLYYSARTGVWIQITGDFIVKERLSFPLSCAAVLCVFFLCGCVRDYPAEALANARALALERTRAIPETARSHIRYTPPEVQTGKIFVHEGMTPTDYAHLLRTPGKKKNPAKDYLCINFVWTLPGADYSVVVLGKGLRDFSFWEGTGVILKKALPGRTAYESARNSSIGYVVNNMPGLSRKEQDRVRFSEAEVYESSFDLEVFSAPFLRKGGPDSWKEYLAELKKDVERYQYSLVWKGDKPDTWIVVSGLGLAKETDPMQEKALQGWSPVTGMVISGDRLRKYSLRKVDTYAQAVAEKKTAERSAEKE